MSDSNMPKMSNRASKALDVLADGGRFTKRLERNSYTGREQFQTRLLTGRTRAVVRGIGMSAFYELERMGLISYCPTEGTSISSYYKLNAGA